MAYNTPILICGCGQAHSLDVREFKTFKIICAKCKSYFSVDAKIPAEFVKKDPSRKGTLSYG